MMMFLRKLASLFEPLFFSIPFLFLLLSINPFHLSVVVVREASIVDSVGSALMSVMHYRKKKKS